MWTKGKEELEDTRKGQQKTAGKQQHVHEVSSHMLILQIIVWHRRRPVTQCNCGLICLREFGHAGVI